jgi:hypothetical protein
VITIVFSVGALHLNALRLAELCGELSHERLAQSLRAIKTEAESLSVLNHAREQVVAEAADTCSGLVIAADEDNEPLVGEGVQQMGGLEFLSAGSHQIKAGVAETRRNPIGQVKAHCDVAEGRIKLSVVKIRRSIVFGLSHIQRPATLETRGFRYFSVCSFFLFFFFPPKTTSLINEKGVNQ